MSFVRSNDFWAKYDIFFSIFAPMFKSLWKYLALFIVGLLLMQFVLHLSASTAKHDVLQPDKVNLALRRTAHLIYLNGGDSTSTVVPITKESANTWLVRLQKNINYDSLPELLQSSFEVYGIHSDYDVAILGCFDGMILLGYNYGDFEKNKTLPCRGREVELGCYNLQVTFNTPMPDKANSGNSAWILGVFGLFLGTLLFALFRKNNRPPQKPALAAEEANDKTTEADQKWIVFQGLSFHPARQVIVENGMSIALTYRESKLLQLFFNHPNQVLERRFLLEQVWEDEGIMVGRSLDVFVSRLRKKITCPAIKIVAVHGIGYRFEMESSTSNTTDRSPLLS
jgi:DNA-binding winged helix-turn-helix (wHTH) protein